MLVKIYIQIFLLGFLVTLIIAYSDKMDCEIESKISVRNGTVIENGDLLTSDGRIYKNGTFWYEYNWWWICPCLMPGPCIRTCAETLRNETLIEIWDGINSTSVVITDHFNVVYDAFCLDKTPLVGPEVNNSYEFLSNGTLVMLNDGSNASMGQSFRPEIYCVDFTEELQLTAYGCYDLRNEKKDIWVDVILITNMFFTVLAFLAYQFLPETKTLHTQAICGYTASYFVFSLTLIFYYHNEFSDVFIYIIQLISPCAMLASFLWVTVMCFDMYTTFRSFKPKKCSIKFWQASAFAWGSPVVAYASCILWNFVSLVLTSEAERTTRLNVLDKTFEDTLPVFVYVIGATILINVGLLVSTSFNVFRAILEGMRNLQTSESRIQSSDNDVKQFLLVFIKLFILMGGDFALVMVAIILQYQTLNQVLVTIVSCRGLLLFILCMKSNSITQSPSWKAFKDCLSRKPQT